MDFDPYSNRLSDLTEYSNEFLTTLNKVEQKHKYRDIHKVIQTKNDNFLKKESKVTESIPRLNILKQIFAQTPILYELNSDTKFIFSGWKTTKELKAKNGSWK